MVFRRATSTRIIFFNHSIHLIFLLFSCVPHEQSLRYSLAIPSFLIRWPLLFSIRGIHLIRRPFFPSSIGMLTVIKQMMVVFTVAFWYTTSGSRFLRKDYWLFLEGPHVIRSLTREVSSGRMTEEVNVKGIIILAFSWRTILCIIGLF